jgi:DNA-binding IscR family transcriptional regulator
MACVSASDYIPCEFEQGCGLKRLWARTRAAMLEVLDGTTIADLGVPVRAVGERDAGSARVG